MKKTRNLLISLVAVLILICITIAVLYFTTDIFKSDKELFYKYASQIKLKDFIDMEAYENYLKRLEKEGHSTEGELSILIQQDINRINESIKYEGYTDITNEKTNYNISLNKDDKELFAINYLHDRDLFGIKFKDIANQYVVVENNNLKKFAEKLGIDSTNIPDRIDMTKLDERIKDEKIKEIVDKYINGIIKSIPKDSYSKIEKNDIQIGENEVKADGYQIKLRTKDLQEILLKVLENVKKDEQLFNLINSVDREFIEFEDYQENIDEIIEELSNELSDFENDEIINISVYKNGKKTIKLELNILEEGEPVYKVSVEKEKEVLILKLIGITRGYDYTPTEQGIIIKKSNKGSEEAKFEINIEKMGYDDIVNNIITLSRVGNLTSNNVSFDMSTKFELQDISINIGFKSNVDFSKIPQIESFTNDNHLIINDVSKEKLENLFKNISNKVLEKLKDEMFISMITDNSLLKASKKAIEEFRSDQEELSTDEVVQNTNKSYRIYQ